MNIAQKSGNSRTFFAGFANLFRRELNGWWSTKSWWIHLLVYALLINGITALVTVQMSMMATPTTELWQVFLIFQSLFVTAGAIISAQSAVVGEKERGTAAWILSKPVSRFSFLFSKVAALALNFLVIGAAVPVALAYMTWSFVDMTPALTTLPAVVAGLFLNVLFYLSFTLMLGTFFDSRKAIAGLAFVLFFVQNQLGQGEIGRFLPGGMPFHLLDVMRGAPGSIGSVVAVTAGATLLFLTVALWRFRRAEV